MEMNEKKVKVEVKNLTKSFGDLLSWMIFLLMYMTESSFVL